MIGNYENRTVIAKDTDAITKEMIRIVEEHLAQFNRLIFQDERDEVLYIRGRIPRSELDWGINFFAERMPGEKQIERKDVVLLYRSLNDGCNKMFRVLIITRQGLYFDKCSVDETCFVKWEYLESTWLVYLESNLSAPDIYNGFWLKFLLPILGKLKQAAEGKRIDIQPNEQIGIHKKPVVESERLILQKRAGYMSCFDLVCGYEDIKAELFRICDVVNNPKKYDEMDVVMPFGILLYGDHGMGKTLMAECFIKECDLPVFAICKEEPDCDVINEIRCAFAEAKNAGKAIVFLDNLDDDADANVYAVLKACMDDSRKAGVFVFAIANDKDNIPDYLLRYGRFDKAIELDNPTAEDTEKILNCYLSQNNCAADVDVKEIAGIMRGNSCADLVMVVNEAAIYACENERKEITQDDLIRACLRKIFDTPEKVTQGNNMELLEAAVHEAGHAVVAEIFSPGIVAVTSVRGQSGNCEGVTALKDADNDSGSKMEAMEHLIIRGLAGKAAIEIVLGRVDMGCASDLSIAFHRVERMVDNLCAFGFETYEGPQSSEAVRAKKEQLIATQMGMYYKAAKKILAENRTFLDKVTEELMRSKMLRQKDIKKIRDELAVG